MTATDHKHHRPTVRKPMETGWLDPRTSGAPQLPSDADRREAAALAKHSLGMTHAMMWDSLAVPCNKHGARGGQYCFGSNRSGVRGVCPQRITNGQRAAARKVKAWPEPPMLLHQYVVRPVPATRYSVERSVR